jgi:hypothetical protein
VVRSISACLVLAVAAGATTTELPPPAPEPESQRLLVELAANKACERLRGQLRAVSAADRPVATGTVWIRDCHATVADQRVTFAISGGGWRWFEPPADGPVAAPPSDWRFDLNVVATGRLAVAYEPGTRTASVTFTPDHNTSMEVTPAAFEARNAGRTDPAASVHDAVAGALSIAIAAPDDAPQLAEPGTDALVDGLVARFPLCLGVEMFRLGSGAALVEADAKPTAVELHPRGLAVFGPQPPGAQTVIVRDDGRVHAALVCARDAERAAQAYLDGRPPPTLRELASADVSGAVRLHVERPGCTLALVLRARDAKAQVHWWRPPAGPPKPALACPAGPRASS